MCWNAIFFWTCLRDSLFLFCYMINVSLELVCVLNWAYHTLICFVRAYMCTLWPLPPAVTNMMCNMHTSIVSARHNSHSPVDTYILILITHFSSEVTVFGSVFLAHISPSIAFSWAHTEQWTGTCVHCVGVCFHLKVKKWNVTELLFLLHCGWFITS